MQLSMPMAIYKNFLGHAPDWYKQTIIAFLFLNPVLFFWVSPYLAGWVLILEFIFTLAMALKCYPLQPGGLLLIQALMIGMSSPAHMYLEIKTNLSVVLLLVFMVAGIYFMKELLLYLFTKLLIIVKNKRALSLAFMAASAFLSAFLDALTVIAVIIAVGMGFYSIYHKVASGKDFSHDHDHTEDHDVGPSRNDLEDFRAFLRNLMMHAAVGTALGGVMTMVGEPQNLIIAEKAGWDFAEFFIRMSPITIPVFFAGLLTAYFLEKFCWFSYGAQLPNVVRGILTDYDTHMDEERTKRDTARLLVQALIGVWLIIGLALHLAEVGLIGLSVIVLATTMSGVIEEHSLGKAFEEALPFTALLCIFFGIVAVIIDQGLFKPVIDWVLTFEGKTQLVMFYLANGALSMVSDNVFVGSVYITEVTAALEAGTITRDQFDMLAVAINTGTNLPSVATPNGQAAFLFLLTSAIAPLLRLSYGTMVYMAFPFTIVLTLVGLAATYFGLYEATDLLYELHWIEHHTASAADPAAH